MSIEFHCNHCGKLVRAPADAGGKHGKCPACHQSVYIPMPSDQIEPLDLAPVNDQEERQRAELLQESLELERRLLAERDLGREAAAPPPRPAADQVLPPEVDAESLVFQYVEAMAAGDLASAEDLADEIRRNMAVAEPVIQRLMMDELLPQRLANIPRPVLLAFLRQLQEK